MYKLGYADLGVQLFLLSITGCFTVSLKIEYIQLKRFFSRTLLFGCAACPFETVCLISETACLLVVLENWLLLGPKFIELRCCFFFKICERGSNCIQ